MKRILTGLRHTYTRIREDVVEGTPLPLFTSSTFFSIIVELVVIALCLGISTGIMYLLVLAMGTHPPLLLYPLAIIVNVLYCVGGMAMVVVLGFTGLLLTLYGIYWMGIIPLTVGMYLWSLIPSSNHVQRK